MGGEQVLYLDEPNRFRDGFFQNRLTGLSHAASFPDPDGLRQMYPT